MTFPHTRSVARVLAGTVAAAVLAGCSDDPENTSTEPSEPPSSAPSSEPTSAEPSPSEPTPSEPTPSEPVGGAAAPVYFAGETPEGLRLFREFRTMETDDALTEATDLMTRGASQDTDYASLFPTGTFESVTHDEAAGEFAVVLADDSWAQRPNDMPPPIAGLAVQQLVYTVQGVVGRRDPVKVYAEEGGAAGALFGVDTSQGLQNAPQLDVLALVNVTTPEDGSTVADTFTAEGVASSFEANVPWQIVKGNRIVLEGFATAEGFMNKLYPWTTEVDVSKLAPGKYSFIAFTDDPGGEGPGATEDSKAITVE